MEKVRGKPLSPKKQLIIHQASMLLLIILFILVTWNDILRMNIFGIIDKLRGR